MITIPAHLNIISSHVRGEFRKLKSSFHTIQSTVTLHIHYFRRHWYSISSVATISLIKPVFLFSAPLHLTQVSRDGRLGYQTWASLDNSSRIISGGLPNFSAGRLDYIFREAGRIWSSASFRVCAEFSGRLLHSLRGLNFGHRGRYSTSFRVAGHRCSLV